MLFNLLTTFVTGAGGVAVGIMYGTAQNEIFGNYLNSLTESIGSNINLTHAEIQN